MVTESTTMTDPQHEQERHETHAGARERPSYDDVNTPVIFLVGVISMILTFLTIWFIEGVYYQWKNQLVEERLYDASNPILADKIEQQKAPLDGNDELNIASVESVIDDVIEKYSQRQSGQSPETPEASESATGDASPKSNEDNNGGSDEPPSSQKDGN